MKLHKTSWGLVLILGSFLFFQFILIVNVTIAQYDEAIFLDVARNIARSGLPLRSIGIYGKYYFEHTPLYPYFLGVIMKLLTDNVLLLRLVTLFFAIGCLSLTYLIALKTGNRRSGIVAVSILALNPFFIVNSYFIQMEIIFVFFVLLTIWFFLEFNLKSQKAIRPIVCAALSIAIAVMLKEIGLAFLAATLLYVLFLKIPWRIRLLYMLILILPTAVLLLSWLSWASYLDLTRFQESMARWTGAWGSSSLDPRARVNNWNWLKDISRFTLGYATTLLLIITIITAAYNKTHHRIYHTQEKYHIPKIVLLLLLYMSVALSASMIMSLKEKRHLIALLPTAALLIALLVDWSAAWAMIKSRKIYRIAFPIAIFMIAWSISPLQISKNDDLTTIQGWIEPLYRDRVFKNDNYLQPVRDAGSYISEHSNSQSAIIVVRQGPVVGYYADRSYWFMYTRSFAKNMELLLNTEYVVVDSTEFWQQTPKENASIFNYIYENFKEVGVFENPYNQVIVYQRQFPE